MIDGVKVQIPRQILVCHTPGHGGGICLIGPPEELLEFVKNILIAIRDDRGTDSEIVKIAKAYLEYIKP